MTLEENHWDLERLVRSEKKRSAPYCISHGLIAMISDASAQDAIHLRRNETRLMINKLYPEGNTKRRVDLERKKGDGRSDYRRDYARLLHSASFRRLQGKMQLFPSDENDFFRNRFTHSLEVSQIATGITLDLNKKETFLDNNPIDVDLVSFLI
jgi:tRNA(Ile)-lysidine synthase TilS/MesJ